MKLLLLLFLLLSSLLAKPTYNIAILTDGQTEFGSEFEAALKTEITQILGRDFNVKFPKKLYRSGKWNYQTIAANVNQALRDKRSNLIITIGALSSHYIARKKHFSKPVIATAIIDPKMQSIPYKNGVSGKYNLTYVSAYDTLEQDIDTIQEIKPIKKISILIDAVLLKNTPSVGRYIKKVLTKRKIEAEIIPVTADIDASLNAISDDTDFVYVTPLFQQTQKQRADMYATLISRELPTFAAIGEDDVHLGALFANAPATDTKRFIRQIALDVQQIALGVNASEQLVNFVPNTVLSINMKTANEIGYTPSWELLSKANIIQSEQSDSQYFTIEEIMNRAVAHNLAVISSEHQIEVSKADLEHADSLYLPQIHLGAEAVKVDQDRAIASLGSTNELEADVYIKFTQQVLNLQASAQYSINEHFLKAQNQATDFVKLDIGLSAAVNYLRILQLRTKLTIEKANLELSKTNMRSAITKRDIGIGSASDIYRWQTQIAGEKKSVLFTHSLLQQAKHTLNSLLDLPQDLPLNFESIDVTNEVFMTNHEMMREYFLDQTKFAQFQSFLVEIAKNNMPTIKQYDALEEAKKIIVESNNDAFYIPTISFEGGVKQHFIDPTNDFREQNPGLDSQLPPYADNTDWEVGVYMRFPLYTGGGMTATLDASRAAFLAAQAQRKSVINRVEKDVRNALYQAKASYLSIKLAQDASVSSKKNLQLITAVYNQGGTGIIDLLDAQNVALRAALQESNTRYAFMRDLLILQHNIGQVNFHLDDDDWNEWITMLQEHDHTTEADDTDDYEEEE